MNESKKDFSTLGVFIWSLVALILLYESSLTVMVSTISDFVMFDLQLNAQKFAFVSAGFYLCYAAMQLPVGILVDRYGPRILLFVAICIAALGTVGFSFAHAFTGAFLSRCLMGFGSSFGYISLLVITLNWFPRKHFGFLVGVASLVGATGPMLAGGPLAFLLARFNNDWRLVFLGIGAFGLLLAFLAGLFVRSAPGRKKGEIIHLDPYKEPLAKRLFLLFKNSQVWFVIFYAGFNYVCLPLLGAYWGPAYMQARGLSLPIAASITSMLWLGLAVGSPLLGKVSDRVKRRKPILSGCALLGFLVSIVIVYWPTTNPFFYGFLFFCIGFASSGQSLSFVAISEHVQPKLHAVALGVNNTVMIFCSALFPSLVGYLITRATTSHTLITISDFQAGLVLMPFFYVIAFLLALLFIHETFCRQRHEVIMVDTLSV